MAGLMGAIRASTVNIGEPIWRCPEIWVSLDFIDRCVGWSWNLMSGPILADDDEPWRFGLAVFLGHGFAYTAGDAQVVWQIIRVDNRAGLLLGRWPD